VTTKPADRSIPLGNDASSNNLQNDDETFIDATAENIVLPEAAVGATGMSGVGGKKKADDINVFEDEEDEKSVPLPWYWSPYLWAMVAALIVALVTIGAVVGVLRGKESDPVPSPPPTMAPTAAPLYDPIKVGAFERHIGGDGSVKWQDPSTPQNKAYQWLMSEDETTRFYENMREEEIGIMKTRYALAVFYYALGGETWIKSNDWLNIRMDHCNWQFVDCRTVGQGNVVADTEFKPVTGLQITKNNLYGSLPSELGHLSKLEFLVLTDNIIERVEGLLGVDSLKYIYLGGNRLQDHENLFQLSNLQLLNIPNTEFSGTLPLEIQQLSNMKYLDLSQNNLQGPLTNRFQTMSSLHTLDLDGNGFNSTLDEILNCGNCVSSLVNLKSRLNGLVGEIPEKLFDFTKLSELALAKSRLTGTIPSSFGKLTELKYLDLTENFYLSEGNTFLPSEMGSLTKLTTLRLSDSAVGGTVPQEFSNLSNLETLWIVRTSLTGSIPDELCAIDSLETIQYSSGVDCSCPGTICEFIDVSDKIIPGAG